MADKRSWRRRLWQLKRVKTWQLLIVLLLLAFVAATFLRLNNLGMVERREAVLSADERGDKAAIERSLVALQHYVSSHMNASLQSGIYLEHEYQRDRDAALEAAAGAQNPNSSAYQQASVDCQARFQGGTDSFRNDYVQCVIERVAQLNQGEDPVAGLQLPRADMYHYNFVSPLWTPDFAGIFVLLCGVVILLIIFRFVWMISLRILLKFHYRNA